MAIEASIILEFAPGTEAAGVVIEVDEEHPNNQYTDDNREIQIKSSFLPEDSPVFLINYPDTVVIEAVRCTHGTVSRLRTNEVRSREGDNLFTTEDSEVSLSYNGVNSIDYEWFGNSAVPEVRESLVTTVSGTFPCYCRMNFDVVFQEQWQLSPPVLNLEEEEVWPIYVVIYIMES